MSNRKAVVEIQFNWLFIMIVGAILLFFFITLAGKFRDAQDEKIALDVIEKLGKISTSSQLSSDTCQLIDVRDIELTIGCDIDYCTKESCDSEFDSGGKGINAPDWMDIEPLFAPSEITGDSIAAWALELYLPFKVTNILYLTSPDIRYVLVYDEDDSPSSKDFAEDLYYELMKNKYLNVEKVDVDSLEYVEYQGESFTKIIFTYIPSSAVYYMHESISDRKRWDVMYIQPDDDDPLDRGFVLYRKLEGNIYVPDSDKNATYIGLPLLIGAIYSDDYSSYKCNLHKVRLKYIDVTKLYDKRAELLFDRYDGIGDKCEYYYTTLSSRGFFSNINSTLKADDFTDTDLDKLWTNIENLEDLNKLASQADCALVY